MSMLVSPPPPRATARRGERSEREERTSIAGAACICGPLHWAAAGRTIGRVLEELSLGV